MSTADISTLQVKVTSDGVTATTTKLNNLATAADKAEKAVKNLATSVVTSNAGMAASAGVTVALTNAILQLNTTISSLSVNTNTNTNGIRQNTAAMRDAHDAARGLAGSLGALWVTYGNMLPLAAGLAMGSALKGIVGSGKEVENAIEAMRVKGGESVATADMLREAILSVGQGVYGPREVAKALDALILAGLSGRDAINALGASLNLATAGGGSVDKAAESLVTIGTAVGATSKQYDYLADGIAKAANTSLASVDSIAEAMKRGSVVNKLYGATFEDILVQTAALSQLGIKNSAAGTAITNFYGDSIGKTEKAKKALQELGMSFFDVTGRAKPLVEVMEEFQQHLNKFTESKQKNLIMDLYGERGMRDVVGLLAMVNTHSDTARSKLAELEQQIQSMAGTSALAAAQLSLTTENQFKSVQNTLESTFVKVFKEIEPQLNVVSMRLKAAFSSPEFATAITNIATAVGNLTVGLAENAGMVEAVIEGILAYKAITTGGAIFSAMIPLVQGMAVAFGAVAVSAEGAAVATGLFGRAITLLPGIGLALGAISAVMALVYINSTKMRDSAQQTADAYNTNYLKALTDEAERLEKTNALMLQGASAAEANAAATRELALAKAQANNQDAIESALKKRNAAQVEVDKGPGLFRGPVAVAANEKALGAAQKALDEAIDSAARFDLQARDTADRVIAASERQRRLYKEEQDRAKQEAAGMAGTNGGKTVDKEFEKRMRFYESERLELERLMATYKARTAAVLEGAAQEQRVMASVEQDRVKANGVGKYPTKQAYNAEMELAKKVDMAKFDQQNANAVAEQQNKITDILNREAAYQKALKEGDTTRVGMLEKQTQNILNFNHASKEAVALELERAKRADEILRIEDARKKLESSAGSANQRAQTLIAEADAMGEYGKTARATAVEVARLEIEKLKLNNTGSDKQINARLEAAAMEDLARSYNELTKQAEQLQKREEINAAVGVAGVIGAETAKVEALRQTTEKALAYDMQRAESALEVARISGSPETVKSAQAAYDKMAAKAKTVGALIKKQFTIDFKVAGLKDVGDTFSRMAADANAMGESFAHVGTALEGVGASFSKLAEIQAATGISEEERQNRQIGAYGDMAAASASFFQENSKGYKIMMGVSKVFHALEMAQSAIRMGKLAIEAVLNQSRGDPYTAFARMAAMGAAVAALGYAVSGGFSSDNGGKSAEDVQKTQGAGSVFGDTDKKSETILKSMETLKDVANSTLPLTQQMAMSLSNIESSMVGITNLVLRTTGVANGTNLGIQTGTLQKGPSGMIGSTLTKFGSAIPLVGGLLGAVASLWGKTTQEIKDSGIALKGTVSQLQAGQGMNQYASVDTTSSSWFGLKKNTNNKVITQGLTAELSQQFSLIFTSLEDTLKIASTALGKSGTDVENAINNLVIDASVSLKDLKGDDLTAALNGVISKSMDQIAEAAFPQMGAFRQVGEGYAQTVVRVATSVEQASVALKALGIASISYTDMTNKTGDVAYELVKQSIELKEAGTGVGQIVEYITGTITDLTKAYTTLVGVRSQMDRLGLGAGLNVDTVNGAGGADKLSSALDTYQSKYFNAADQVAIETAKMTDQFKAIGSALPDSRDTLRSWIEQASKAGDQLKVGQLLALADAFDTLQTHMEDLTKATQETVDNTIDLAQKAFDAAMDLAETAYGRLEKSINAEKDKVQAAKDATQSTIDGINAILDTIAGALKSTAPLVDKADAFANALDAISQAASLVRGGQDLNSFKGLDDFIKTASSNTDERYSSLLDFQRDQARANVALSDLNEAGKGQLSAAERQLAVEESQLAVLDKQLEAAQAQLDALKGVDNSLLSLKDALSQWSTAVVNAVQTKAVLDSDKAGGSTSAMVESLYGSLLNRKSDAAGKDYWVDAMDNKGVALPQVIDDFMKSNEYKNSALNANGDFGGTAIESLYQSLFSRKSDAAGKDYWTNVLNGGASISDITAAMMNSDEYKAGHPSFDVGTNSVPYDMVANIHKGERIIPAADNAELMRRLDKEDSDNAANATVAAKLDNLIEAIQQGDVANVQKTNELYKLVRDRIVPNMDDGTTTQ